MAKLYSPQEALLASVIRITPESPAEIALRAGVAPAEAGPMLSEMRRRGLLRSRKGDGGPLFGLNPQSVGVAGTGVGQVSSEIAGLWERYYQESRGQSLRHSPAPYRVIPIAESVSVDLEIHPFEQVAMMVESAKAWGVRDCICRLQKRLTGDECEHPLETCLVLAPWEGAFDKSDVDRPISKQEALGILREAEETGLVHSVSNFGDWAFNVCNCCTCSCGLLRAVAEFSVPTAIAHSDFWSVVDAGGCRGCGDCVDQCLFRALSITDGTCVVDHARCLGCGYCVVACVEGALRLERRPPGATPLRPSSFDEWMMQNWEARGVSPEGIL